MSPPPRRSRSLHARRRRDLMLSRCLSPPPSNRTRGCGDAAAPTCSGKRPAPYQAAIRERLRPRPRRQARRPAARAAPHGGRQTPRCGKGASAYASPRAAERARRSPDNSRSRRGAAARGRAGRRRRRCWEDPRRLSSRTRGCALAAATAAHRKSGINSRSRARSGCRDGTGFRCIPPPKTASRVSPALLAAPRRECAPEWQRS